MEERSIQISAKTILKVIGILVGLYLLFLVREILLALLSLLLLLLLLSLWHVF
jgi:Mn2+/Fe2+ NRAMP family transporter